MSTWLKLLIPLLLGGAAALGNYLVLVVYTEPETFLQITDDIPQGESILKFVQPVELSGRVSKLLTVAVSGRNYQSLLEGRNAARPLKKNDLLLWQDVVPPSELQPGPDEDGLTLSLEGVAVIPQLLLVGQQISFVIRPSERNVYSSNSASPPLPAEPRLVGPFRLLSVGPRLNRSSEDRDGSESSGRTITVAIPAVENELLDGPTRDLVQAISQDGGDRSAIRAIVLHRLQTDPVTTEPLSEDPAATTASDSDTAASDTAAPPE